MKTYKKSIILAALLLVSMLMCLPAFSFQKDGDKIILRVGSPYPEKTLLATGTRLFVAEMEKRTNGRISFKKFYGGTLTKPNEIVDATSSGRVDLCTGLWIYAPGKVPLGSFEYNFIFNQPDRRVQARIKREMYERIPAFNEELAKFNIGPNLQFWGLSAYDSMSRMPLKTLGDLKGKRFDATPVEYVSPAKAAGMVPVPTPAPRFYEMLERGTVDLVACCRGVLAMFKIYEVAPYFLKTGLNTPCTMGLWINMDTWKKLSQEDRELFIDVGKVTERMAADVMDGLLKKADATFKEKKVTFFEMSEEDRMRWANQMPDLPAEWATKMEAKGLPGWEIVRMYLELSEKEGWKFPRKWGQK